MVNKMFKTMLLCIGLLLVFTACSSSESEETVSTNEISFGVFGFEIPDYYNQEPTLEENDAAAYTLPDYEDNCRLIFSSAPYDRDSLTKSKKKSFIDVNLNTLGFYDVDSEGDDGVEFEGVKDGIETEGIIDVLFSSEKKQVVVVTLLYNKERNSDYEYRRDFTNIISSATVDGVEGAYNAAVEDSAESNDSGSSYDSGSSSSFGSGSSYDSNSGSGSGYNDWDTDNNGEADWRDVDTDNDGNVSEDEMNDYLNDWEQELQ